MAKQTGEYKITGTYDGVTYYRMEGQYYARAKSSLKGIRVKKDPRFKRTMEWARRLATGSRLASQVYRSLPREEQVYALFCTLKSTAIRGLKEGRGAEEMKGVLEKIINTKYKGRRTKYKVQSTKGKGGGTTGRRKAWMVRTVPLFCKQLLGRGNGRRKEGLQRIRRAKWAEVLRE